MKNKFKIIVVSVSLCLSGLVFSTPSKWQDTKAFLKQHGSHSMLVLQEGEVVFEYGDVKQPLLIHSIRKAVLNGLIGLSVKKGTISLDSDLASLNIDDIDGLSDLEKSATVLQLMQSRSGIYHRAGAETEAMAAARPVRGSHKPGEHYYYNNWNFNTLGSIYEQQNDRGVLEATFDELAVLAGFKDIDGKIIRFTDNSDDKLDLTPLKGFYQHEPEFSKHAAYHMRLSTRDLAAYGQWMLDNLKGKKQDLPVNWVAKSSRMYSVTNEKYGLGYGLLWNVVGARNEGALNSFYHTGLGVHFLGIYPNSGLVIVHRVNTEEQGFNRQYVVPQVVGLAHRAIASN